MLAPARYKNAERSKPPSALPASARAAACGSIIFVELMTRCGRATAAHHPEARSHWGQGRQAEKAEVVISSCLRIKPGQLLSQPALLIRRAQQA